MFVFYLYKKKNIIIIMTEFNFDNLVSEIEEMDKKKGNECLICQFTIEDEKEQVQLKCKHYYHKKCINYKKMMNIKCPYCSVLSLSKDIKTIQKVCKAIYKSGQNKGKVCGRINCKIHKNKVILKTTEFLNQKYDNIDYTDPNIINAEKIEKEKTSKNICKAILKTGKNKGKLCNRINCKLHNNDIIL